MKKYSFKNFFLFSFLIFSFLIVSCTSVATRDRSKESFNFYLAFGVCHTEIINTEDMTFTRKATKRGDVKIALNLTDAQIDTVRQMMDKMNFYTYSPENWGNGGFDPHPSYRYIVKNGEVEKLLKYEDPNPDNPTELDELNRYIIDIIKNDPEYKKLPDWNTACL